MDTGNSILDAGSMLLNRVYNYVKLIGNVDFEILIGTLTGSFIFSLTKDNVFFCAKNVSLCFSSFSFGVFGHEFMESIIDLAFPMEVVVPNSIGAVVASSIATGLLMRLSKKPIRIFSFIRVKFRRK
ncbi:putative holin [Enterobacter hormaechei]|uniref:putative holin n=1 Tax=Enterobacter hormaechei TaxID=158836 RepID=UPI00254A0838|nr:putative holin [Enterobacter hormaechei]MDK9637832.1 putative holin [Enterobacter hormaechei]